MERRRAARHPYMELDRRDFLKTIGIAVAAAGLPGCEREAHNLVPLLLPDGQSIPGRASWYTSACDECRAGCGILVRVMEGRAKKIEGHPDHPVNRGKVCAKGQAALQGLYNPDRLRQPLRRDGRRGEGRFQPIGWDEAVALWIEQLHRHRGAVTTLSRPLCGTFAVVAAELMQAVGGEQLTYDPMDSLPLRRAAEASFGTDRLPYYDLAQSDYLLSFGAPFLEHWISPVALGRAFGEFRGGRTGRRGRFVQIEPRLSVTAASADRWVPVRPGAEGWLALGIGRVLLDSGRDRLQGLKRRAFRQAYDAVPLERAAALAGLEQEEIVRLAREFMEASAPLAIGGGTAAMQTNGTAALAAVNGLNVLAGNLGKPGGIRLFPVPALATESKGQPVGERRLRHLSEVFRRGPRRMLQLYRADPLFNMPASAPLHDLFHRSGFVVSFSPFLDDSTAMADLILPDHHALESWGDLPVADMAPGPVIGLRQPVVQPLGDTRATGDLFLAALRHLGGGSGPDRSDRAAPASAATDFKGRVKTQWEAFLAQETPPRPPGGPAGDGWTAGLQAGGWWDTTARPLPAAPRTIPAMTPAVFAGDPATFDLHFCPFPSPALGRGEGANLPWLQQLPDPLTSAVWGTWIEIHPQTAAERGIHDGEIVRVQSPDGVLEVPAVCMPAIRPDVVAMPFGQGHAAYGRYAAGRGLNPLSLVGAVFDEISGALACCATRVRLEATGRRGTLVRLEAVRADAPSGLIGIDRKHRP